MPALLLGFGATGALFVNTLAGVIVRDRSDRAARPLAVPHRGGGAAHRPAPGDGASLGSLAFASLTNVDILLAASFFSGTVAGIYAAAALVGKIVLFLPTAIVTVLLPKAATRAAAGIASRRILLASLAVTLVICLAATVLLALVPEGLLVRAFGGDFRESTALLGWFGLAMTAGALVNVYLSVYFAERDSRFPLLVSGGGRADRGRLSVASRSTLDRAGDARVFLGRSRHPRGRVSLRDRPGGPGSSTSGRSDVGRGTTHTLPRPLRQAARGGRVPRRRRHVRSGRRISPAGSERSTWAAGKAGSRRSTRKSSASTSRRSRSNARARTGRSTSCRQAPSGCLSRTGASTSRFARLARALRRLGRRASRAGEGVADAAADRPPALPVVGHLRKPLLALRGHRDQPIERPFSRRRCVPSLRRPGSCRCSKGTGATSTSGISGRACRTAPCGCRRTSSSLHLQQGALPVGRLSEVGERGRELGARATRCVLAHVQPCAPAHLRRAFGVAGQPGYGASRAASSPSKKKPSGRHGRARPIPGRAGRRTSCRGPPPRAATARSPATATSARRSGAP